MNRNHWTARMLARHVSPTGIFGRPTIAFRVRADKLPSILPPLGGCYRAHDLESLWPPDLVAVFESLEPGWKYVDIEPRGAYVEIYMKGYEARNMRLALPQVALAIEALQQRGIRVNVRDI